MTKRLVLHKGGGGTRPKKRPLAIDRPLVGLVQASELDPKKGLRATDCLAKAIEEEDKKVPPAARGRSRVYPEINVLNAAKAWRTSTVRHARSLGYKDAPTYLRATHDDAGLRLFQMITHLITWENGLRRGSG